jgi:lipopolysaccharide biosynthesis regulator YciM
MNWAFDATTLLWALPLTFTCGWLASRLDVRQWRRSEQRAPKAYFRGLNFLLNEQQDQAIDAFIEAVQHDPETSELHFALGNLFRRRGDYDRAVRVHEHLLARSDLSQADRQRAQHGLAMDFLKAGLLDRAESALRKLDATPYATEALLALLTIFERSRDWVQAIDTANKLEGGNRGSFKSRSAHYHCELAAQALHTSQPDQAKQHLEIAKALSPQAARPSIALANVYAAAGEDDKALTLLLNLANATPHIVPLLCTQLVQLANKCQAQDRVLALLQFADNVAPSIDVTQAMSVLQPQATTALFESHLNRQASLAAVAYVLADDNRTPTETTEGLTKAMTTAITKAAGPLTRYRCAACGFEAKTYFWQCPGCQGWETFPARRVEEL